MSEANANPSAGAPGAVQSRSATPAATSGATAGSAASATMSLASLGNLLRGHTALLIGGAAFIAVSAGLLMWASTPDYRVLFNNLSEADGGRIIAELDNRGVPYRFSPGGQALLVPGDQVYALRLQLAGQGLPQGGNVGFELLDGQRFGISQFAEQVNFQRGLEGELSRSIQSMSPVAAARVHLSLPKPTAFVRDSEPAKASVVLTLQDGRALSRSQVDAIMHLVSSSVPGLTNEGVTVVDHAGNLLSSQDDGAQSEIDRLSYVEEVERRYRRNIENILTPLFGSDRIRVEVAADIDFAVREETRERYAPNQDPGRASVRSSQTSGALNSPDALAQGIPGALSNTPPGWVPSPVEGGAEGAAGGEAARSDSLRYDNLVNYEVDRDITHIQHPRGLLERLSVATVIDYRDAVDAEGNAVQVPLSADELEQVTRLVRQAMGFSEARGDQLEVVNSPFSVRPAPPPAESPSWWSTPQAQELALSLARYLFAGLLLLAAYLLILRPILRRHPLPTVEAGPALAAPPAAGRQALPDAEREGEVLPPDAAEPRRRRERKATSYEQDLEEVRRLSKEDPRLVAMVVRSWMNKHGQ